MQQLARWYSLEEVFKDIETFEGVKLSKPEDMTGWFRNLYTDIHSSPIDGDSTVDDLNERVRTFLRDHSLPALDKSFSSDIAVYASEDGVLFKLILETSVDASIEDRVKDLGGLGYAALLVLSNTKGQIDIVGYLTPSNIH